MAGPECCVPAPPCQHQSRGFEEQIGPFFSYLSTPPTPPKASVLLVSDIHGFETPQLRKLADKIATLGYLVAVPDYFDKDPFRPNSGVVLEEWLKNHHPLDVVEGTKTVVEVLKSRGVPSVGAVGFCWGAKVLVELAKEDHLKAVVFCHPSFVTVEDIQDVKTSIAILASEIDTYTPPALAIQFSEILKSKKEIQSFVKLFPGAAHGWVIRYDVNDVKAVELAEEAHQKIFEWFEARLP